MDLQMFYEYCLPEFFLFALLRLHFNPCIHVTETSLYYHNTLIKYCSILTFAIIKFAYIRLHELIIHSLDTISTSVSFNHRRLKPHTESHYKLFY